MDKRYIVFALLIVFSLIFISYKVAFSFFSDSATSASNTFTAATTFPTPSPTSTPTPTSSPSPNPVLVINEVFEDTASPNEWVEIFNPTGSSVNINGWKIADGATDDDLPNVSIPAGSYGVIITNNSTVIVPGSAVTISLTNGAIGSSLNSTGDKLVLTDTSSNIIDQMSFGNNTNVFASPPPAPDSNQSLARNPNGTDTDTAADWVVDSTPTLGVANN